MQDKSVHINFVTSRWRERKINASNIQSGLPISLRDLCEPYGANFINQGLLEKVKTINLDISMHFADMAQKSLKGFVYMAITSQQKTPHYNGVLRSKIMLGSIVKKQSCEYAVQEVYSLSRNRKCDIHP